MLMKNTNDTIENRTRDLLAAFLLGLLEDGTDTMYRNAGKVLQLDII
jgi:hypothetical protein